MRKGPKLTKYERREVNAEKLKNNMGGSGIYIYENNTDGDLKLPKATESGLRMIGPRKRFQGDSYFMSWVGNPMNLLRLVEVVQAKGSQEQEVQTISEEVMSNEKKLILDQPDTITSAGKVERVVISPDQKPLNDSTNPTGQPKKSDVLLTEDPLDGVEIILG